MDNKRIDSITIPDLSVVIVNWNTRNELRRCLVSVFRADTGNMEVLVVDNASGDASAEMVAAEFPTVRLLRNTMNTGFARGSNWGILSSRGRYVLLLNPDSIVEPGALKAAVEYADANPKIGIIGLKTLEADGTLYWSCRGFPTIQAAIFRNTIIGHFFPKNPYTRDYLLTSWDHNEPRDVDWVSGAAMLLRRKCIDEVGILDEAFFMYCEDVDLCYRANEKGWRVGYFPGATIVHERAKSSDKRPNLMILEHHKSMYHYFKKHHFKKTFFLMRWLVVFGLVSRAGFFIGRNEYCRGRNAIRSLKHSNLSEAGNHGSDRGDTSGEE